MPLKISCEVMKNLTLQLLSERGRPAGTGGPYPYVRYWKHVSRAGLSFFKEALELVYEERRGPGADPGNLAGEQQRVRALRGQ